MESADCAVCFRTADIYAAHTLLIVEVDNLRPTTNNRHKYPPIQLFGTLSKCYAFECEFPSCVCVVFRIVCYRYQFRYSNMANNQSKWHVSDLITHRTLRATSILNWNSIVSVVCMQHDGINALRRTHASCNHNRALSHVCVCLCLFECVSAERRSR